MLWHPKTLQNLAMYNVFFIFWPFFHCRKATKMTQNSISIPSCAQTPKNPRKMSKTPPYSGLGAKPFLAPPAKADIATAILTNVIEHLVLLLPPNKHAFTAKAVWADLTVPESVKLLCLQYVCNILVSNCWKKHKIVRLAINAPHNILGQLVRLGFTKSNSNQQAMAWLRTRAMLCWMPLSPSAGPAQFWMRQMNSGNLSTRSGIQHFFGIESAQSLCRLTKMNPFSSLLEL